MPLAGGPGEQGAGRALERAATSRWGRAAEEVGRARLREETDVRAEAVMWADLISGGACDTRALWERWLSGVMGVECWRG